jgi:hypothetical protein
MMYWSATAGSGTGTLLTNRVQAQMAVSKGVEWCTGLAATGRKCHAKCPVLTDKLMAWIATLYRANEQ